MKHTTLKDNYAVTICWLKDEIVDWCSAGEIYSESGKSEKKLGKYHFAFSFDKCIASENNEYVFLYKNLGTKGLLIKDGEIVREINRSYYQAEAYEYPVCFATLKNGKTCLIHCPRSYDRIDIEDVETGEIITDSKNRNPVDFFHSRFEISPNNKYLLSKGWIWHPIDYISVFDIENCIVNPLLLDKSNIDPKVNADINIASFINDDLLLIGSSEINRDFDYENGLLNEGEIGIWNLKTNQVSNIVKVKGEFGNMYALDENYALDLYKYPKVIDIKTGEIVDKLEEINTGLQNSSIVHHIKYLPQIIFNREFKKIAILADDNIEIISI